MQRVMLSSHVYYCLLHFAASLLFISCITPPPPISSSVLSEHDLAVTTLVKHGKDYANAGRPDLAEIAFRKALKLEPGLANIYNDLGYVLMEQNRFDEANKLFEQASLLDANNSSSRINLATGLYRQGNVAEAIEQYQEILYPERLETSAAAEILLPLSSAELVSVYRNVAIAYYNLGQLDEALCFSALAAKVSKDGYQVGQHARMLLSLNMVAEGERYLKNFIEANSVIPPNIMADYALTLYVDGDKQFAQQASQRVLADSTSDISDRVTAYVIMLLATNQDLTAKDNVVLVRELMELQSDLCSPSGWPNPEYWPYPLRKDMQWLLNKVCSDEYRDSL